MVDRELTGRKMVTKDETQKLARMRTSPLAPKTPKANGSTWSTNDLLDGDHEGSNSHISPSPPTEGPPEGEQFVTTPPIPEGEGSVQLPGMPAGETFEGHDDAYYVS